MKSLEGLLSSAKSNFSARPRKSRSSGWNSPSWSQSVPVILRNSASMRIPMRMMVYGLMLRFRRSRHSRLNSDSSNRDSRSDVSLCCAAVLLSAALSASTVTACVARWSPPSSLLRRLVLSGMLSVCESINLGF